MSNTSSVSGAGRPTFSIPFDNSTSLAETKESVSKEKGSIPGAQEGAPHHTIEQAPSSPRTVSTSSLDHSEHASSLSDRDIKPESHEGAIKSKETRTTLYARISQAFAKLISCFAFPKSAATQKEEAINNVINATDEEEATARTHLEATLHKNSPTSTKTWATAYATILISEAHTKKAVSLLTQEKKAEDFTPEDKANIQKHLEKGMPARINNPKDLSKEMTDWFMDPKINYTTKLQALQKISKDEWPTF